jgi:hypothetical protein
MSIIRPNNLVLSYILRCESQGRARGKSQGTKGPPQYWFAGNKEEWKEMNGFGLVRVAGGATYRYD